MAVCTKDSDCPRNEECKDYDCQCKEDFVRDSQYTCVRQKGTCGNAYCAENAECLYDSQYQIHYCACKPDFTGDGITICRPQQQGCNVLNNCGVNARCDYNSFEEMYQCICNPGYKGDGYTCYSERNCYYNPQLCDSNARCIPESAR